MVQKRADASAQRSPKDVLLDEDRITKINQLENEKFYEELRKRDL